MLVVGEIEVSGKVPDCIVELPHGGGGNSGADVCQIALGSTVHQRTLAFSLLLELLIQCEIGFRRTAH